MPEPELWFPRAVRDPCDPSRWGNHADQGEPKFLLHTTEGRTLGLYSPDPAHGPARRYYGNLGTWPHFTLALQDGRWRVFQHIPAERSAMSLRNLPGGVETNRDNVLQTEIAWQAEHIRKLPTEAMDELARLLAWAHHVRGVPIRSTVEWVAYPPPPGWGDRQRLSPAAWDAYSGVLGHAHAAENDHMDPGRIDIVTLLHLADRYAQPEDDMPSPRDWTEEDWAAFRRHAGQGVHDHLWAQMQARPANAPDDWYPPRQAGVGAVLRRSYEMTGAVVRDVEKLRQPGAVGGTEPAEPASLADFPTLLAAAGVRDFPVVARIVAAGSAWMLDKLELAPVPSLAAGGEPDRGEWDDRDVGDTSSEV